MKTQFATRLTRYALIILFLTGCETVQPWERGILARPEMERDPQPLQSAVRAHNYSSREAAGAAKSATGGGCGCN